MSNNQLERVEEIITGLEPGFKRMWSFMWPTGACAVTSMLQAPMLRCSIEVDFRVVVGWAFEHRVHAWIQSPAGDIIDPTYGQFDGDAALRIWSAGTDGGHEVYKILSLDEEEAGRREVKPRSTPHGWIIGSTLTALFDEMKAIDIDERKGTAA